jgi:hypothetical protein
LFAANGKWKRQTSVCLLKMETENGSLLFLASKRLTVIDDCSSSKCAHTVVMDMLATGNS